MEDKDENLLSPQQSLRRQPGSFEEPGLAALRDDFDDIVRATSMPDIKSQSLKRDDLSRLHPSARSNTENSFSELPSMHDGHAGDSMTEEEQVRAHLQDVESSFIPPISPIQVAGPEGGVDDTYLFDGKKKTAEPSAHEFHQQQTYPTRAAATSISTNAAVPDGPQPQPEASHDTTIDSSQDPHTHVAIDDQHVSAKPRPTNEARANDVDGDRTNTTSDLENILSSPSASAAVRTVSRAISMASNQRSAVGTADTSEPSISQDSSKLGTSSNRDSLSAGYPTLHHHNSDIDLKKLTADAGTTPGYGLRVGRRPKYLRSRHASQRSSTSSIANEDLESDVTAGMGTDYAIQSGGALSAYGTQRSLSNALSRSISMGSMASGIDDLHDSGRVHEPLEPLEEVERSPTRHREDMMATPKPPKEPLMAPTDTVIARHVRNVEVPESLAREYKTKAGFSTPTTPYRKVSDYSTAPGTAAKSGRNLTLKEQSSTIERLSKENFDLKLKVMFLSDRLDKLSEEGIKEMISENVELKTSVAVIQVENKNLRKKVKNLEKLLRDKDEGDRPSTARSGYSSDGQTEKMYDANTQELEEELIYLREQVEEYVTEIEHLKSESMAKEAEKRKLAEVVKTMGDRAGDRIGDSLNRQEEADVFKDLLEQETARREQADEENRRLRDELFRLKQDPTGSVVGAAPGNMHHTTNIYNITRKGHPTSPSRGRAISGLSGDLDGTSSAQSSTLVEDLRKESDQLRHENAELRREVGAQTSMLTSRNREKERLYQEIEDLKLAHRRGTAPPSTVDSILERSASRAGGHERSHSRGSGRTKLSVAMEDPDREELENKLAEHRDKINELKLQNQELQRELETCMEDFESAVESKRQAEQTALALQEDLDNTVNDLMALQTERDEALQDQSHLETEFESLRREAQEEIDALEGEADQKAEEIQRLQTEIQDRSENFEALQEEMRTMSEAIVRLEDEQESKHRRIEQLEQELADANKESEELEAKLLESNEKASRLGVQQESSQGEIAFLREEQEADKIRIGDLEAALAGCEQSLRDERERAKELDTRLGNERRQAEILATREKEEVQQFVNELNRDMTTAKDEARRLRKNLSSREVEATEWKERLMELENNLREALGDLNGTRSSLLKSIAKLQRELENTVRELDATKADMLEKDRIIKQRDALLESHGLEVRKLAEMLDKERQAHRNTKNTFETFQRTHSHVTRTVTSQDSRIMELETSRAVDRKKLTSLEVTFKDQVTERNNLLLLLWAKLSALCGSDWAHNNSLINGRALPTTETLNTMLPGFSKNLLAAVKMIESLVSDFQGRIKGVERELWKEYQSLEQNLDVRTKKLERLEAIVRNGVQMGDFSSASRLSQLEATCRALKIENATLARANDAKTRAVGGFFDQPGARRDGSGDMDMGPEQGSPSPSVPTGPMRKVSGIPRSKTTHLEPTSASQQAKSRTSTMSTTVTRSASSGRSGDVDRPPSYAHANGTHELVPPSSSRGGTASGSEGDNKWMFRLRELEHKLKQEREDRNMDRAAAKQRILEGERQKEELVRELVRARKKTGGAGEEDEGGVGFATEGEGSGGDGPRRE